MLLEFARAAWRAMLARGIVALLFGLVSFVFPAITVSLVFVMVGVYMILDGAFALFAAFRHVQEHRPIGFLLFEGVLGVVVGVTMFTYPLFAALAIMYLVAFWALLTGIWEIILGLWMRKYVDGAWALICMGFISVGLALCITVAPGPATLGFVWFFAGYATAVGILLIMLALKMRAFVNAPPRQPAKRQ